jgi:urocanate hydratase
VKNDQEGPSLPPVIERKAATPTPMRAPRGVQLSCKGWKQEAAFRMLTNTCDPDVSGQSGPGAGVHPILAVLQSLACNQTLVVQRGLPPEVFHTDEASPRVVILNGIPAPDSKPPENFHAPERCGGFWFGAAESESWTSAGAQSAVCAAFMTLAGAAQEHFSADLMGKFVVSGGLGAFGRVLPLAATMNGAAFLGIEADESKILERIRAGYCDICVNDLDEALRILKVAIRQKQPVSVGLVGNYAEVLPEMARRGIVPDLLTDLTGARAPLNGYLPAGMSIEQAAELRVANPQEYLRRARDSSARHVAGILDLQRLGAAAFDFGNEIGAAARGQGAMPHFATAYLGPLVRASVGPMRWFALSGERNDIFRMDDLLTELAPQNEILVRWLRMARKHVRFQGLPARVAWLAPDERGLFVERMNQLVARGELKAPVVLCRDSSNGPHFPRPAFEAISGMLGSALAPPLLDAAREAAAGAAWVLIEIDRDRARLSTQAVLADGTPEAAKALSRIFGTR